MQIDVYVYDENLELAGVVDAYKSLIWADRYNDLGDCELYLPANSQNIDLLTTGRYLARPGSGMVCRIKRVELDTDAESGDYLVINGVDTKGFLDQRVVMGTVNCNGGVEAFCRRLVNGTLIEATNAQRNLLKSNGGALLTLGNLQGLSETAQEQMSYKNIGEKVREYCKAYGWGYKVYYAGGVLAFELYKGIDRRGSVVFSDEYENLASTKYVFDCTKQATFALVAGAGEGTKRSKGTYGGGEGTERYEIYFDARDIAQEITWEELTEAYPTQDQGGRGYISGTTYYLSSLAVQVLDSNMLNWLRSDYPSGEIVIQFGLMFYRLYNVAIADLETGTPEEYDAATLRDIVYKPYLIARGRDGLAEYGKTESFSGSIIPDRNFIYGEDYFLGDIVTVRNTYGMSGAVRVVEVIEVIDENGLRLEPKFESVKE